MEFKLNEKESQKLDNFLYSCTQLLGDQDAKVTCTFKLATSGNKVFIRSETLNIEHEITDYEI